MSLGSRHRSLLVALAACFTVGAATTAPAAGAADRLPLRELADDRPLGNERLSNETTITRFAHVNTQSRILSAPRRGARTVGRLRYRTEDGPPELYLLLEHRIDSRERDWVKLRVPGRPNGRVGWVRREALGPLHVVRTQLVVNRKTLRATLYKAGRKIWSSRVGIGKSGTPTPAGRYWIRTRLKNFGGSPIYGPWAFGTAAYSRLSDWPGGGVVGIHGTNAPGLLPGRVSHGCIRVPNWNILKLKELMPVGTPIWIHA